MLHALWADLVREGTVYDLSLPVTPGLPVFGYHHPYSLTVDHRHGDVERPGGTSFANELLVMSAHTGTHLDALCHFSRDGKLHDGRPAAAVERPDGFRALGIETTPPILRRGVLLDVAGAHGVEALPPGYAVEPADLEAAEAQAGVRVGPGDAALVRTGWVRYWDQPDRYNGREGGYPGVGPAAARWLVGRGVALTGSDTTAYEVAPPQGESVHGLLLVDAGVQIVENLNLEELAAARVAAFLLIVLPLRLVGATASPVRPIAVV